MFQIRLGHVTLHWLHVEPLRQQIPHVSTPEVSHPELAPHVTGVGDEGGKVLAKLGCVWPFQGRSLKSRGQLVNQPSKTGTNHHWGQCVHLDAAVQGTPNRNQRRGWVGQGLTKTSRWVSTYPVSHTGDEPASVVKNPSKIDPPATL